MNFISYYCAIIYEFYCKITSFTIPNILSKTYFMPPPSQKGNLNN